MSIEFEHRAEAKAIRERVRQLVNDKFRLAEKTLYRGGDYAAVLTRPQRLSLPLLSKDHGCLGLGPLSNPLVSISISNRGADRLGCEPSPNRTWRRSCGSPA